MLSIKTLLQAKAEPSLEQIKSALKNDFCQYENIDSTSASELLKLAKRIEKKYENMFGYKKIYKALFIATLAFKRFNDLNALNYMMVLIKKYLFFDLYVKELEDALKICVAKRNEIFFQEPTILDDLSFSADIRPLISNVRRNNITLAERLDNAYELYEKCSALMASGKHEAHHATLMALTSEALKLLENILDTKGKSAIMVKMRQRQTHKQFNAEYIPGKSPLDSLTQLPKSLHAKTLAQYKWRKISEIGLGKARNQVLTVTESAKNTDKSEETIFLDKYARDMHRVLIINGKFHERQVNNSFTLADTEHCISHSKSGFSAFTVNLNGEISLFNHFTIEDGFAHSSMNAQAPLFYSGEIQISQGELRAISVHSMHYRPGFLNLYLLLQYFISQGVDISKTILKTWGINNEPLYNRFIEYDAQTFLAHYNPITNEYKNDFEDFDVDCSQANLSNVNPNMNGFFFKAEKTSSTENIDKQNSFEDFETDFTQLSVTA
ncbi:MAG TPA: hypothetical protein VHA13_05075 [Gammaproteobacteria bacterium]|nr:hypothetical protein [Gammaproteobacteria bacterium]